MYLVFEVVEMGKAQDIILHYKDFLIFDDAQPNSNEFIWENLEE